MQSVERDAPLKEKKKSKSVLHMKKKGQKPVDVVPSDIKDDNDHSPGNAPNQLVLYNPSTSDTGRELKPLLDPSEYRPQSFPSPAATNSSSRVLSSVGAFTVQCAICFKWRLIPTKERYEEIRENILQDPFICERAREWRPDISCDDPADISQDGSRLWAIDKPNIAQPPPGWERILRIRGEGSTKFADVYYAAPSGKRLRSMVEVQKYLLQHPEYIDEGVNLSQFSFQTPKPLQENYVRKRPARVANPCESPGMGKKRPLEPVEVSPISWAGPDACTELQIGRPGSSSPYHESPVYHAPLEQPPAKKKTKPASKHMMYGGSSFNQAKIKVEGDSHQDKNTC